MSWEKDRVDVGVMSWREGWGDVGVEWFRGDVMKMGME